MNPFVFCALAIFAATSAFSIYCAFRCVTEMQPTRGSTREMKNPRSAFEDLSLHGPVKKGRLFRAERPLGLIILLHNWGASKNRYYPLADELAQGGFHVFLYDLRGQGENQETHPLWIWGIAPRLMEDCRQLIEELRRRPDLASLPIFLAGYSLGSGIALEVFKKDPSLAALLCDSGPFSLKPSVCKLLIERTVPHRATLTKALINAWFCWIVNIPRAYRVLHNLEGCSHRPLMLVQNGRETFIPIEEMEELSRRWPGPLDHWRVERAQHLMAYALSPEEYQRRVLAFFQKALGDA